MPHLHLLHHHQPDQKNSSQEAIKSPKHKIILPTALASTFRFVAESLGVFWAIYFTEKGLNGTQIGAIFAVLSITGLLITLPSGLLSDRLKTKYLIIIGIGLTIIQFFGTSLANTFWPLVFLFFLGGLGQNVYNTSLDSLFYKNLSPEIRDSEIGFYLSLRFFISGLGVIFGGLALSLFSFPSVLKTIAVFLTLLIVFSLKLPNTQTNHSSLKAYKKDLFKKEILVFIIMILLFSFHGGAELTSLGPFLKNTLNLSPKIIGLYAGLGIMSMAFSTYYASKKLQTKQKNSSFFICLGFYMSAIGMFTIAHPNPYFSFLGRLIHVSGDAFIFVLLYHDIASFFPAKRVGGDASLITLILICGSFFGSLFFGPLSSKIGYSYTIIISSATTFLALIFAWYQTRLIAAKEEV